MKTEKPRPIVVLADNSQSMTHKDPRPAVADKVRVAIANDILPPDHGLGTPAAVDGLTERPADAGRRRRRPRSEQAARSRSARLRPKGPVQPFLFGSRLRGFADTDDSPVARGARGRRPEDAPHRHAHGTVPARRERPAGRDRPRHRRPRQRQHGPVGRRRRRGRPARRADPRLRRRRVDRGVPAAQGRGDPGHAVRRGHRHRPVPLAGAGHQGRRGRADPHPRRQGGRDEDRRGQGRPGR